jgi:glutamyl-Q tRNA(Asp) synthetase
MILAVSNLKNPMPLVMGYRGRFAPSPTGPLHAGSLVAALGSWLDARANKGKWLLRIEDIDTPRCIPGADQEIMRQLSACGLYWDEEVSWQSTHQKRYEEALERLNRLNYIYPCACSRQSIANHLSNMGIEALRNQETVYPEICRPSNIQAKELNNLIHEDGLKQAWRLALPNNCEISFDDRKMGRQTENLNVETGDFVLRRNDGLFTYQLAVVVDDAAQGITHIVRGEDLMSNTARQIHLQQILGYAVPSYLHLPLVLNNSGEKLSKQTLASAIQTHDEKHVLAELRKAAAHLGLIGLPDSKQASISEWLLAATQSWENYLK